MLNLNNIIEAHTVIGDGPASPFFLEGWLKWNEEMWEVKSERVVYKSDNSEFPRLEGVIYKNTKGQVVLPPRNPYLPFRFVSTATKKQDKVSKQYMGLMNMFVEDLLKFGIKGSIALSPGFIDARVFQWNKMNVEPRYTFMTDLPYDINSVDKKIKSSIKKAEKFGYRVELTSDWDAIHKCLSYTEEFKNFSHRTDAKAIELCANYMGDNLISHIVYSKNNEPVSGGIRLLSEGGIGHGWSQGGHREHLKNGVNQFLYKDVLLSLHEHGATKFDWGGANTEPVAYAKSAWGMSLVPYLVITPINIRYILKSLYLYLRS